MKICIAQLQPNKGHIKQNIEKHIRIIRRAIQKKAKIIVFPELSLTGYEPTLARETAVEIDDSRFKIFQEIANSHDLIIAVGIPLKCKEGITISLLFFSPNTKRFSYAKQILHMDELPYFVAGNQKNSFSIENQKIAFGICYESLQTSHVEQSVQNECTLYIASVAKSEDGMKKAMTHFHEMASRFKIPIFLSNAVGPSDNFICAGQSSAWNRDGVLLQQLDQTNEGFIIYDSEKQTTIKDQLHFKIGVIEEFSSLFKGYMEAKDFLERTGIFQWTDKYPNESIIEDDLVKNHVHLLKWENEIYGAINLSEEQEEAYQTVD